MKPVVSISPCLVSPSYLLFISSSFFSFPFPPCHSSAWEEFRWRSGKEVDSSWTPLPSSTWSTGWFCVCVCVKVCWQVATGRRWVKGSKRKKMGLGRAVKVEEGCPPAPFPFSFFFFFFKTTEPRCSPNRKNIFIWLMTWWRVLPARVGVTLSHCHWGVKHSSSSRPAWGFDWCVGDWSLRALLCLSLKRPLACAWLQAYRRAELRACAVDDY